MTPTSEIEKPQSTELAPLSPEEEALVASIKGKIDREDLILPQIRLTAALSKSVQNGDAKPGEFVNSLTGENHGDGFEFVIVDYFKGRFLAPKQGPLKGQTFVAMGDVAPGSWPDEYAGQHFADLPDAEEQWAAAANAGGEWGDGPPIRTTYNYVGFVVGEDRDLEFEIPGRLSLQRTSRPASRKINTLIDLSRSPWDRLFEIKAVPRETDGNSYHVVDAGQGRAATAEERAKAVKLATELQQANIQLHGEGDEDGAAGKAKTAGKAPEGTPDIT